MGQICQTGQDAASEAIRKQADIIVAMAEPLRALDAEAIHDMRVASRRLRMALRIYKPYLPQKPRKALRRHAKRITGLLGNRRELDVMAAMLREHRAETRALWQRFMDHAIETLEKRRADQAEFCLEAATLAESETFTEAVAAVVDAIEAADACVLDLARSELMEAWDSAREARKVWKQSKEPEDLHQVRIELKHLRYACEFHRDLYGEPMSEYIRTVKEAQSVLGEWNECRLLEEMVITLGNAFEYHIAQGAPLVAEAYGNRAEELAIQFRSLGKGHLNKAARKRFASLIASPAQQCCRG